MLLPLLDHMLCMFFFLPMSLCVCVRQRETCTCFLLSLYPDVPTERIAWLGPIHTNTQTRKSLSSTRLEGRNRHSPCPWSDVHMRCTCLPTAGNQSTSTGREQTAVMWLEFGYLTDDWNLCSFSDWALNSSTTSPGHNPKKPKWWSDMCSFTQTCSLKVLTLSLFESKKICSLNVSESLKQSRCGSFERSAINTVFVSRVDLLMCLLVWAVSVSRRGAHRGTKTAYLIQ